MIRVELAPTTIALERAKTAHALDRAAIVLGLYRDYGPENWLLRTECSCMRH
jgi:hypothetical protein